MAAPAIARAEFIINNAIIEFLPGAEAQQDIELASKSDKNDYIDTEINEIINPGSDQETRRKLKNAANESILVTPNKTVLTAGSRKILRFILLQPHGDHERIYRVAVKPVVNELEHIEKVGLKILIGYEILVIVRPNEIKSAYNAKRNGKIISIHNTGNSSVLFQASQQCIKKNDCKMPPSIRAYAGQHTQVELPFDAPAIYNVWDGVKSSQVNF